MLTDLDELVLKCRDERARKYIDEAVRCYRGGAYRAAVVSTWIAVCFDTMDKLRELSAMGDKQAATEIQRLDEANIANNIAVSSKFEESIPELALRLGFVNHVEKIDLERLRQDRHRCAHPSKNNESEVFEVPSELARLHIRNAVFHFLQHEPAQGKSAVAALFSDINSRTFPSQPEKILERLRSGPLRKPREVLVRNVISLLVKSTFKPIEDDKNIVKRSPLVLKFVRQLHPAISDVVVPQALTALIANCKKDDDVLRVVVRLDEETDFLWELIDDVNKERLRQFVLNMPTEDIWHMELLSEKIFKPQIDQRYRALTFKEIEDSHFFDIPAAVIERLIYLYAMGYSAPVKLEISKFIINNSSDFSTADVGNLIRAVAKRKGTIHHGFEPMLWKFVGNKKIGLDFVNNELTKAGLGELDEPF